MRRDFRSRCLPMTDGRGSDAARALRTLQDDGKTCTSATEVARFWLAYVVAQATTYKDFQTLSPPLELPHFPPLNSAPRFWSTEAYSLYERELAR
jgi:hypothetical protein